MASQVETLQMCYLFLESALRRLQGRVGIAQVVGLVLCKQVYLEHIVLDDWC
jgi:hypothetical protein